MKTCDVNTGFYTLPVPIFYILLRRDKENGPIQRLYEGKKDFPNRGMEETAGWLFISRMVT